MEFEIDESLVQGIISDEYARARAEIAELGPLRALEQSQQRHDARLAQAADAGTLACKAGCFWCCYFTVDVRPVEVVRILEFMETSLPPEERKRIVGEIVASSAAIQTMNEIERMRRTVKCAFLADGRCTIYAARPQTCRNYHATDVAGCEKSFHEPENEDIDPEFAPLVYQSGGAHVDGFSQAMQDAGYDVAVFELNTALAAALAQPVTTRKRFEAGESLFADLQGEEVVPEFGPHRREDAPPLPEPGEVERPE
ncbi:MAG: YkgJ family cysteine cluster protein [Steroidobacteraceae bacterium]